MTPALFFLLSILIVRLHLFSMPMTDIYWSEATDDSTMSDLFNYWKAVMVIGAACLAVVIFIIAYFRDTIHFKKSFLYIPILVYISLILLSLVFSDYKYFALRGMSEHFEGTIVLLAYMIMIIFLSNAIDSDYRLKTVIYFSLGVSFILGILGITQAIGHDFFSTAIGQKIITPNYTLDTGIKSWDMIDILQSSGQSAYDFSFTEGEVYQTVYNINYVPLYLTLLISISAILFIYFSTYVKISISIPFLALYGLFLFNLFAADSASGYFGLIVFFVSALFVARKRIRQWIKPILCLIVVLGLIMGFMTDRWLPEIRTIINSSRQNIFEFVYADDVPTIQYDYDNKPASIWTTIDYVETNPLNLVFSVNGNELIITRVEENSSFAVTDGNLNTLYMSLIPGEDGVFQILDDRYHDYVKLSLQNDGLRSILVLSTRVHDWHFAYSEGQFTYINSVGKDVTLSKIPHSKLIKNYSFATFRGLIWDTIIPQLGKYVILGAGADAFTFVYPQNDYATAYTIDPWTRMNLVTDKAHNLYLQYWVNTGLISLLAWLTMVGYYLVGAAKQFRKRGFVDFCDFVNGGIFCGICGFLAVAFFNDGSVNTMPMFYTMLGTGLAINMRDKWPSDEPVGETNGTDGMDPVEGKKKGKKAKATAEVMPEM